MSDHEHQWGLFEISHMAGTVHRKCKVVGCDWVYLSGDWECTECGCEVIGDIDDMGYLCPPCLIIQNERDALARAQFRSMAA